MFEGVGRTIIVCGLANPSTNILLQQGYNVVLLAHSQEQADVMAQSVPEKYRDFFEAHYCLIEEPDQVIKMAESTIEKFGSINVIATGAGQLENLLFSETSPKQFDEIVKSDLHGLYIYLKTMIPYLLKFASPRIINFTSVDGKCGHFGYGVSSAAGRGGIVGLTRAIALEYAHTGLTANCIAIGAMRTLKTLTEDEEAELIKKIPVGRIATAADISSAICYLAGVESGYMTGAVLNMSGGAYMD